MMVYKLPDGTPVAGPFELNGISYPSNWLELATPIDIAALGVTVTNVPDPAPPVAADPDPTVGSMTVPELKAALGL